MSFFNFNFQLLIFSIQKYEQFHILTLTGEEDSDLKGLFQ